MQLDSTYAEFTVLAMEGVLSHKRNPACETLIFSANARLLQRITRHIKRAVSRGAGFFLVVVVARSIFHDAAVGCGCVVVR